MENYFKVQGAYFSVGYLLSSLVSSCYCWVPSFVWEIDDDGDVEDDGGGGGGNNTMMLWLISFYTRNPKAWMQRNFWLFNESKITTWNSKCIQLDLTLHQEDSFPTFLLNTINFISTFYVLFHSRKWASICNFFRYALLFSLGGRWWSMY